MAAYLVSVTDGRAVTLLRKNFFEATVCADTPEQAVSEVLVYVPPALKSARMVIELRPVPLIQ